MKKALPIIAIAIVAVAIIAVGGALGISAVIGSDTTTTTNVEETTTVPSTTVPSTLSDNLLESVTDFTTQPSTEASTQTSTTKPTTTKPSTTTTTAKDEETTTPKGELDPDEMSQSSGAYVPVTPTAGLPSDMTFAGLYKSGYNVIGLKSYIYNDDKDPECMQKHFGYSPTYDALAGLIDFSIDTTRIDFKYEGKPYRIQLWKGQYISGSVGTVGGEIGVYTRTPGKIYLDPQFYDCAAEEDWLKMEMTILWDENGDGNYLPQFTRNYDDFWWATGFVDGQLKDLNDSNSLRLLGRLTFESEEQAQLFAEGLKKAGFTQVSTFNPNSPDTFKIYGKDVMLLWQYVR